jgi:hypothetical protein
VVGIDRGAPLGAEHEVQRDRAGWLAGLHPAQPDGGGLPEGEAKAGLLAAVLSQCLDGEGWQGEDGVAGRGLERPDGQFLAPATQARAAVASSLVGEDRRVDDGERLAEPDGAGVQVEVGPFQAAQLAVAGPGCRGQDRPGPKPRGRCCICCDRARTGRLPP